MNKLLDPNNKIFTLIGILGDHLVLGLMWFLCSVPVITAGAATTAVYDVSRRILERREFGLFRDFFRAFRRDFKQSTLLWLPYLAVGLILTVDLYFYYSLAAQDSQWAGIALGVFGALSLLYLACLVWIFPYVSRFRCKYVQAIRLSFMIGMVNLGYTVLMIFLPAALAVLSVYLPWLLPFLPGLILLGESLLVSRVFRKYTAKKNAGEETN